MSHDEKNSPASHLTDLESGLGMNKQGTVMLSDAQFEKLYLQSGPRASGDLRKRFANPTPLGLVCFCVPLTTLAAYLLQFKGTSSASVPVTVGAFYFVGGLGQTIAGILEFFLGNTFPFVVFVSFSGLYYSFGFLNDINQHLVDAFGGAEAAEASAPYLNGIALYLTMWTCMLGVFTLICLRINGVYTLMFFLITVSVAFMSAAYYSLGDAAAAEATEQLKKAGGFMLASSLCGWYLVFVQLLASVDFMFTLPVGDLSNFLAKRKSN